jgi:hypothetical protein
MGLAMGKTTITMDFFMNLNNLSLDQPFSMIYWFADVNA